MNAGQQRVRAAVPAAVEDKPAVALARQADQAIMVRLAGIGTLARLAKGSGLMRMPHAALCLASEMDAAKAKVLLTAREYLVIRNDHDLVDTRRHLVAAIVAAARALALSVVAEVIETEEQVDLERAAGCTDARGCLCSPPRPACDVEPMLLIGPREQWQTAA